MKKRVLSTIMILVLVLTALLSGCASEKEEAPAADEGKLKVAVIVNQKFGDNGPMDDLAGGVDKAASEFGVEVKKLESTDPANFEADIRAMAQEGYGLIITTFPYMTDATKIVAAEYPDTKFSGIFQFINMGDQKIANIWDTEFHGEGAFYLGGYMAGKLTKTNKIGIVIGGEEPSPNAEGNAFMRGALAANPNVSVESAYVGSYEDPAKAKEITAAMIAKGCDFVQTDSGASNAGVVEAAKEANILCAGEITDFYSTYPGFVGIIGIGFGQNGYDAIKAAVEGNFPGGEHGIMSIQNGGYFMDWASYERFAAENKDFGPDFAAAIAEAKALEAKIMDGSLEVPFDAEVPNWDRVKAGQ